ncbi:MAG: PAS domain S-box protein [Maribacter sp.]
MIKNNDRLHDLESYDLIDTLPESIYDDITQLAAAICSTPISLISLINDKKQFFKSHYGLEISETPLDDSFCKYVVEEDTELLIVEDASKDERFSNNRLVSGAPHISFYAGVPLTSPKGLPLGTLCVVDNKPKKITQGEIDALKTLAKQVVQLFELRKATKEIAKKNKALEKIMRYSLDIICTIDKEGHFLEMNTASKKTWGYLPEELIGKKYIDFVHFDDVEATKKSANTIFDDHIVMNFENRYLHKNGSIVSMLWSANCGEKDGVLYCVAKDITATKEANEKLQQSERRFKTLIQEGSDLIGILDSEANYSYVSPTSLKVLHTSPEEFIGTNALDYIHPEDQESVYAQFEKILENSQIRIEPFRFKNKEGEWRWVETIITNQLNEPSINGIVANSRDITDRKMYLSAIEEQNEKLKEIAWTQSHIVRAPVARLMGLIDLMKEQHLARHEKEGILSFIMESAEEIDSVIKNVVENAAYAINKTTPNDL